MFSPSDIETINAAAVRATVSRWIVHEIRGPIHSVAMVADILAQSDGPPDAQLRDVLTSDVRRLRELLDVLVRVLQPQAVQTPQPVALTDVVELLTVIHRCHRGRVVLEIDRETVRGLPAVRATVDGLLHVILNLFLNAIEVQRDQTAGAVRMAARLVADGRHVELTIEDEGPGLPDVVRARLHAAGDQPTATTASGLGLPVARTIIERWGGSLTAAPSPTRGARLVVTLPAWRAAGSG